MPDQPTIQQPRVVTIQRIREVVIRARIETIDPATGMLVKPAEMSPELPMAEAEFAASMSNFLMSRGVPPECLGLARVSVAPPLSPPVPAVESTSTTPSPIELVREV